MQAPESQPLSSPTGRRGPLLAHICLQPSVPPLLRSPPRPLLVSMRSGETTSQGQGVWKKDPKTSHLQFTPVGSHLRGHVQRPAESHTLTHCSTKALSLWPLQGGFRKPIARAARPCPACPAGLGARGQASGSLLAVFELLGDEAVRRASRDPAGSQGGTPTAFSWPNSPTA